MSARVPCARFPTLLRVGFAEAVAYRAEILVWMLTTTMPLIRLALWTAVAARGAGRAASARRSSSPTSWPTLRRPQAHRLVGRLGDEHGDPQRHAVDAAAPAGPPARRLRRREPRRGAAARCVVALPVAVICCSWPARGARARQTRCVLALVVSPSLVGALAHQLLRQRALIGSLALLHGELDRGLRGLARRLLRAVRLPGPLELFPPGSARVADVLPFRYKLGFPVEMLIGRLDRRGRRCAISAIQWAYVAALRRAGRSRVARRPAALRGVRRLSRACATSALLGVQLRASLLAGMQYRCDFLIEARCRSSGCARRWCRCSSSSTSAGRRRLDFSEALLVVGWFTLLKGMLDGAINPSLHRGGRAHPQRHARLRAAQAGRRAVPGLDREVRAVEVHRRWSRRWPSSSARSTSSGARPPSLATSRVALLLLVVRDAGPLLAVDPGRQPRRSTW